MFLSILTFSLAFQVTQADTPPILKERWSADYAEKMWGIKIRNVRYIAPTASVNSSKYEVVLEFTRDLKPDELKLARAGFARRKNLKDTANKLEFHFFDKDGVVLAKCSNYHGYHLGGDLTGIKGDAFRAVIELQPDQHAKVIVLKDKTGREPGE